MPSVVSSGAPTLSVEASYEPPPGDVDAGRGVGQRQVPLGERADAQRRADLLGSRQHLGRGPGRGRQAVGGQRAGIEGDLRRAPHVAVELVRRQHAQRVRVDVGRGVADEHGVVLRLQVLTDVEERVERPQVLVRATAEPLDDHGLQPLAPAAGHHDREQGTDGQRHDRRPGGGRRKVLGHPGGHLPARSGATPEHLPPPPHPAVGVHEREPEVSEPCGQVAQDARPRPAPGPWRRRRPAAAAGPPHPDGAGARRS